MNKVIITDSFYRLKSKDRIGGRLITEVFKQSQGTYLAFSFYTKDIDEAIVGHYEDTNENNAICRSRKCLRSQWITSTKS